MLPPHCASHAALIRRLALVWEIHGAARPSQMQMVWGTNSTHGFPRVLLAPSSSSPCHAARDLAQRQLPSFKQQDPAPKTSTPHTAQEHLTKPQPATRQVQPKPVSRCCVFTDYRMITNNLAKTPLHSSDINQTTEKDESGCHEHLMGRYVVFFPLLLWLSCLLPQ